ncbi:MAG: type I polyketide synthase, partial [Longimicrobiales bacterium]|nr:type I polyketide synthase [Longimicrobiales bacterium]
MTDFDPTDVPDGAIAIVGMAGRFPGARSVAEFWRNLREGRESITRLSDEMLEAAGISESLRGDPDYVGAEALLDRMEYFDAGFFGMSPRDAAIMDPQVRNFLECSWHALEHAAHLPDRFTGSVGVFAGCGLNRYFWQNLLPDPELRESVGFFLLRHTGNDKDFLATRVSWELDLTGPSVGIQTACSTSLVAVHYACQSLLAWECDMALAGGVSINQPQGEGYLYQEREILSPDGHCRSFDARAEGTVFGSGVGVVALRRLEDALSDGDTIHAVIRGSAVNNDGSSKVSYLAPSVDGQARAIAEAISVAGVDPETIGFVEGHGTATPIGDPIEVAALTQAFRTQTEKEGYCALGSVKSNIGHLDTAAGVASLIKAVEALKHAEIPPTVHFEKPNAEIDFPASPFFVNRELLAWPDLGGKRRAGVSSLGVGGTNAHVVLEEAPAGRRSGPSRDWQMLPLSGRSRAVVEAASRDLIDFLEEHPGTPLADISHTLRLGRARFRHRRAVVCRELEGAVEAFATGQGGRLVDGVCATQGRPVAFLFAGGGAQHPHMGRELHDREEVFRDVVDRCLRHMEGEEELDLRALLFPSPGQEEAAARELQRPSRALPALFATQLAHAHLWMSWGVRPASMIGHSMGEYTAACLAGVFSPEEGLSLVTLRGRLFESLDPGAMTSVNLGVEALQPLLGDDLSIAAVNAPELTLAAGPVDAVAALEARLAEREVETRRIRIDVAAHSSMLEPILPEFRAYVEGMKLSPPELPFVSNLTGDFVRADEVTDPEHWVRHLRNTVRFSTGLARLLDSDGAALLEVGPGRTLATLAKLHPDRASTQPVLHSLPHPGEPDDAQAFTLTALGALWVHGVEIDWDAFDGSEFRRRIPLPGYPFERERHFVEPPARPASSEQAMTAAGDEEEKASGER